MTIPKPIEESTTEIARTDHKTISNVVLWGVVLGFVLKVGSVLVTLVLVRLLSPEIYGQYGLVAAVLMFALAFSMQRFMEHSFHGASEADKSYKYHLGFGVLLHLGIFVLFNLLCFLLPLPENYDAVKFYLHIGSFSILLNVPRIYYSTHLRRILDWQRQRMLHLFSFLLSTVGAISLALFDFGVMALLAQNLLVPVPYIVDLVWRRRDMLAFSFDLSLYKKSLRFGMVRSGSAIVTIGQKLIEASAFTAIVGFASFGIYGRALGLGTLGAAWLSDQIHGLMYPVLAKVSPRSDQSRRAAGLILRLATWSSVPMAVALSLTNSAAVNVLYGPKWTSVSVLLPPALILAVVTTITNGLRLVILTNKGPKPVLVIDAVMLAICVAGLYFALEHSLLFYCWFIATGGLLVLAAIVLQLLAEHLIDPMDFLPTVAPMSVVVAAGVLAASYLDIGFLEREYPVFILIASILSVNVLAMIAVRIVDPDGLRRALVYVPAGTKFMKLMHL